MEFYSNPLNRHQTFSYHSSDGYVLPHIQAIYSTPPLSFVNTGNNNIYLIHNSNTRFIIVICRVFTFPGSIWIWQRNSENHFRKAFVMKIKRRIISLRGLIEYIREARLWHGFMTEEDLGNIRRVITSIMNLYTKQTVHQTISKRQKQMMGYFSEIESLLFDIHITNKATQTKFTLWKLLQGDKTILEDIAKPNSLLQFEEKEKGDVLFEKCKNLERELNDIVRPRPIFKRLKRWMYDNSFGTLDQLREEIDNKYKCKRIALKVEKKVVLDCMFISGRADDQAATLSEGAEAERNQINIEGPIRNENNKDILHSFTIRAKSTGSVMILCCPNAGYYECMHYENDWIDFYVRNGLGVFLWNYRGYGRSTGTPYPDGLRKDGEAIVDYLRQHLKVKKIGVHGESLGGMVATHLARKKNLDFLCVDRSFMNLSSVGILSFGKLLGTAYKLITLWDNNISTSYTQATCYKVMTFDPKDEVIHALSSLAYGVTRKVLEGKFGMTGEPINPPLILNPKCFSINRLFDPFRRLKFSLNFFLYERRVSARISEYYYPLSKEQITALFWAIHRVSELFVELSATHGLTALKKQPRMYKPMNPRSNSKNTKLPSPHGGADCSPELPDSEMIGADETTQNVGIPLIKKQTNDELLTSKNSKTMTHGIELKGICRQDESYLIKTTKKKSYLKLFEEETKKSDEALCLLIRAYPIFDELEAAGIHITDISEGKTEHQFDIFKFYIHCFEIWGSYYPLYKTIEDDVMEVSYYHQNAVDKLRDFLVKLDQIIKKYRLKEGENSSPNSLLAQILDDFDLISSVMSALYHKLSRAVCKNPSGYTSKIENEIDCVQDELTINNPIPSDKTENKGEALIVDKDSWKDISDIATASFIGFLIPLSCGHNSMLRPHEMEIYEYHLKNAKMI